MNSETRNQRSDDLKRAVALLMSLAVVLATLLTIVWALRGAIAHIVYSQHARTLDTAVFQRLHSTASAFELQLFVVLTEFGSPVAMTVLAIIGAVWLSLRSRMTIVAVWIAALAGSSGLSVGIKHIFERQRPPGALEFLTGGSYSFPSTHTLCSLVGYGMLAYILSQYFVRTRALTLAVVFVASLVIAVIAVSRLILGVHYLSDVTAGLLAGSIWLSACICVLRAMEPA